MSVRDKSQKIGFVYTNIYQLYKKSQNAAAAPAAGETNTAKALSSESRVWRPEQLEGIEIKTFQPRTLTPHAAPAASPAQAPQTAGGNPFDDLKANLSRLQDLHAKLRFMLKELEDLVEKK